MRLAEPVERVDLKPTPVELAPLLEGGRLPIAPRAPPSGCDFYELLLLSPCEPLPSVVGVFVLLDTRGAPITIGCVPNVAARVAHHLIEHPGVAGVQLWMPHGVDEKTLEIVGEY